MAMTRQDIGTESTHTAKATVLVVDDDRTIRHLLTRFLNLEDYRVVPAADAAEAMAAMEAEMPDLVVLDVMLGEDDGLDVLEQIRLTSAVPVILLTGKTSESDRVMGLKLGADDYVVKPFSPAELVARVDAVLRRNEVSEEGPEPPLHFGELEIDLSGRRVLVAGEEIVLTQREFDLLAFLARHPGQVFTRDHLMEQVWRFSFYSDTSTVTVHIRRLRAKIEPEPAQPRYIETVWGVGYRFRP